MKLHSTNYFDTFIQVAEDTKAERGTKPPAKDKKTVAEMQYQLIAESPYKYTSDDVFFLVHAARNNLKETEYPEAREAFFIKGKPCFRASPLTKTYGFGIHSNSEGKVALFGMETEEYRQFLADAHTKKISAMKSSK